MSHLVLCPACQQHVRSTEERCPFCAAPLGAAAAAPPAAAGGLARATLFALHAALATGAAVGVACDNTALPDSDGGAKDGAVAHGGGGTDGTGTGGKGGSGTGGMGTGGKGTGGTGNWPAPPYGCVFPDACGSAIV